MPVYDIAQLILYIAVLIVSAPFLGFYMFRVYQDGKHPLSFLKPLENGIYRLIGIDKDKGGNWKSYALSVAVFSALSILVLFVILATQQWLPLNPQRLPNLNWTLAINVAISFVTNTNWQSYNGETTLSFFSQMTGLAVQNFTSAAVGLCAALALIRGISAKSANDGDGGKADANLGNFWVDMTRSILYILLPLSFILALVLVSQGVIQNFDDYKTVETIQGETQILPMGPAASQIAIKQLGTNGGGFFGANSAHPFENPTPVSNFLEALAILLIPAGLPFLFGFYVQKPKQGVAVFSVMFILFLTGLAFALFSEYRWGTWEGKEMRFGTGSSVLWSVATTAASNGSVNAMHSSLSPLAGMIAMLNIQLGEIIFGGIGSGLYGMLVFIFLTVFIAGLMVGRSPEYLGKKIGATEIKISVLVVMVPLVLILVFSSIAVMLPGALSSRTHNGSHGLSEILYAFTSAAGNNGSAFSGLNANTGFFNVSLAFAMLVGRFGILLPVIALGGCMGAKKFTPESTGTLRTDSPLFVILAVFVILIVGGLTFFPVLTLGPILEHLMLPR